ncbi:hypothetical protein MMAD_36130 [Mycolicibacterium madagascariense]|uniref:Uncharacterized protein n=1 Tax=Mycolicibacterium madagascariense TaxID=212765 RepID=A0A7I7XJF4_9MYCO|nr:hypothetical protein MMAD_36130 [Mycolicibacterium madagascariense]
MGQTAPATYEQLKTTGSYGALWIVESDYVPAGYASCVASYGSNSPANAIGVRQHPNAAYQGFRTIPGNSEYPIIDSFYTRAFALGRVGAAKLPLSRSPRTPTTRHQTSPAMCLLSDESTTNG